MMCSRARTLLGAYRRDDWTPAELAALGQHLSICADCRKVEAAYRRVGESIRQLPTITPPPVFRERVFAAIQAEQGRLRPAIERLATEDTSPAVPVVRPVPITRLARPRQMRVSTGLKAAFAIAAILLMTIAVAQLAPLHSLATLATNLNAAPTKAPASPAVAKYMPDATYSRVTGALASKAWLVYVASNTAGNAMLFAENRQARQTQPLLSAAPNAPVVLQALTDHWVLWSVGTAASAWTLYAQRIPAASGAQAEAPRVLATSVRTAPLLADVWARGDTALVALAGPATVAEIESFDLSNAHSAGRVVVKAEATGHVLTGLSSDGSAYYWADVWLDRATGWHSRPWHSDTNGQNASPILDDDHAFHPQAGAGTLSWVEVPPSVTSAPGASDVDGITQEAQVTGAFTGAVITRDLNTGHERQVGQQATVASLHTRGTVLLWHSGTQSHTYDLRAGKPSAIETQVSTAAWAETSDTSVTWCAATGAPIYVYDV